MTWNHLPTPLFFLLYVSDLLRCVKHYQYLLYPGCSFFIFDVLAELFSQKYVNSFCFFSIYIFFFFYNSLPASDLLLIPADSFFPLCWFSWDVGEDWALWSAGFNDNEKHQFYSRLSWKLNVRGLASVLFLILRTTTTTTTAKEGTVATTIKTKADTTTE